MARSAPSHYLNHSWNIANWTLRNRPQWNLNPNLNIIIQENAFESVLCKMAAILFQPQCVKRPATMCHFRVWCSMSHFCDGCALWNTTQCCYVTVNFPQFPHNRHPNGRDMMRLMWISILINVIYHTVRYWNVKTFQYFTIHVYFHNVESILEDRFCYNICSPLHSAQNEPAWKALGQF